ncbi:MAG: 6-phospho-beta-glucosidase [Bacilli bacterium]
MKLVILGGAGLRTPLFISGLVKTRQEVHFDEVVLFDPDEERMALIGELNRYLVESAGSPFRLTLASDLRSALAGADFIFSAPRVGQDAGRLFDETVALKHGVIGQETTGPGGFATALRTIPVLLEYAKVIREAAPNAWVLNFTNPSGLIAQALNDYGGINMIGVCDSPSGMAKRLARYLSFPQDSLQIDYFGLNHLGWVRHVWSQGRDHLPGLLAHYDDLRAKDSEFGFFDTELVQNIGMLPNEHLYYFYYRQESVDNILSSGLTRGGQIKQLNDKLMGSLRRLVPQGDLAKSWSVYLEAIEQRRVTYMSRETTGQLHRQHDRKPEDVLMGGYEEMALSVIRCLITGEQAVLTINVPNRGAIAGFAANDVVEIPCLVGASGYAPLTVGEIPAMSRALMEPVKTYERLTVEAAVHGDYRAALNALTVHPLVPSFHAAKSMLDEYLEVHKEYLPQFK